MRYFNPPAPWGAGPSLTHPYYAPQAFQSTRPVGGGTGNNGGQLAGRMDFNPPAPWGAGPVCRTIIRHIYGFQSTRPVGGGTFVVVLLLVSELFQSTRPVGGGTVPKEKPLLEKIFQSTRPVGGGTAIMHKICFAHFCNLHNHATVRVLRQAMTAAAAPSGPDSASIFRCEPFGIFLTASASHRQIIRTPSA